MFWEGASSEMDPSPLQYTPPIAVPEPSSASTYSTVILTGHGEMDNVAVVQTSVPVKLEEDHIELAAFYHGINFTDNYLRLGIIKSNDFPIIMGSECTGIISRVGANVDDLKAGDRVICLRMHAGLFRRMLHVHRKYCYPLADHISLRNGVALGLNFVLAHICLFDVGKLKPGQIVFMPSIGGSVGTAVIQLARSVPNVKVVGTASESKHAKLLALGADHVFRHGQGILLNINYPRGADIIINSNGGSTVENYIWMLKPYGRLINIGSNNSVKSTGLVPMTLQKPKWDNKNIRSVAIVGKNCVIRGMDVGYYLENHQPHVEAILNNTYEMVWREEVKPVIHTTLPLAKASEGLNMLCERENVGKVILHEI